ncbi:MAG: CHAT domain-containing protein [Candidatus Eremiobacterota bacterium]
MRRSLLLLLALFMARPSLAGDADLTLAQLWCTVRVGSYRVAEEALPRCRDKTSGAARWERFYGDSALVPRFLDWGRGRYERVLASTPAEADWEAGLLAVDAAFQAGLPREIPARLDRLEKAQVSGARGRLVRFLVVTYRGRLDDLQRRLPPEEWTRRFDRLELDPLPDPELQAESLVELALVPDAVEFWAERLDRQRLERLSGWLAGLYSHLQAGLSHDNRTVHFWDAAGARFLSFYVACRSVVTCYGSGAFPEAESEREIADFAQILDEEVKKRRGRDDFNRYIYEGHLAATAARAHQGLAWLAFRKGSDRALAELTIARDLASDSSDQALKEELKLDRMRFLEGLRPKDWQLDLEKALVVFPEWTYRPYEVERLWLEARLRLAQGRTQPAQQTLDQALTLLEAYVNEAGGQGLDRFRPLYELRARLLAESGGAEQALAVLDRGAQFETTSRFSLRDLGPEAASAQQAQLRIAAAEAQARSTPGVCAVLADTRADYYTTLQRLQREQPEYLKLSVRPDNFSRSQKSLPVDSAVVQVFLTEQRVYLFVVTRDKLKIHQVETGRAEVEAQVQRFRTAVARQARGGRSSEAETACLELGGWLWAPLVGDLEGIRVVAFIPMGTLSYFPMQALALPAQAAPVYLVERHAAVVLTKSSDMDSLARDMVRPDLLAALADPDGSLPAARQEVQALQSLFPRNQVWLGPQATADRLRNLGRDDCLLHLATHGVVDTSSPTDSYLLMAGGRLSVTDIAALELPQARLVTLSACQTALADRVPDSAWLATLADAFGFAGSPSLVASLWSVSDASTRDLMVAFYAGLAAGKPRAVALQEAQLALLRRPDTAHPFHWAGFELIGDWR